MLQGTALLLALIALGSVSLAALLGAAGPSSARARLLRTRLASIRDRDAAQDVAPRQGIAIVGAAKGGGLTQAFDSALQRSRIGWSAAAFILASALFGLVAFLGLHAAFGQAAMSVPLALALALLVPWRLLRWLEARQMKLFSNLFPEALDVIVRGVKAGLPLVDCMRIISGDAPEPVRSEFRRILEDQSIGMPIDEAVDAFAQRMPTSEARFFSIVIAINSRVGGNLSEALGNLAGVIRERKKMRAKIKALSAEAKASAMIVGAMPVFVGGLVYVTSPQYISLLFSTTIGNIALVLSGLWMGVGMIVMRKMTNFEI